jgi:hypothetical protein
LTNGGRSYWQGGKTSSMQKNNVLLGNKKVVIVMILVCALVACHQNPLEEAREQVPIGTTREDAISILGEASWYHQPCPSSVTIDDLFFFGSHEYDKADVVIVRSEPKNGIYVVYGVSSFESYAWHTAYADCLQRDKFE